ncbi:MAG: DUF1616 domain-containing protein, partial [Halobacteriales archaeon]|nr:DUF1616 domain-containing protein [Halobacteriales archaeon]
MLLEGLRVVLGLALTLVLPGAALSALLWPWKPAGPWEWGRRALVSVELSIAVLVLATIPLVYG